MYVVGSEYLWNLMQKQMLPIQHKNEGTFTPDVKSGEWTRVKTHQTFKMIWNVTRLMAPWPD